MSVSAATKYIILSLGQALIPFLPVQLSIVVEFFALTQFLFPSDKQGWCGELIRDNALVGLI